MARPRPAARGPFQPRDCRAPRPQPGHVKTHVASILSKLGVSTREEAAAWQPEAAQTGRPPREPQLRRWWSGMAGWLRPVTLGKATLIGAAVAVVAGLGVLAWGVLREAGGQSWTVSEICPSRDLPERPIESEIWMTNLDGGQAIPFSPGFGPIWSSDGRRLAFSNGTTDGLHFGGSICAATVDGVSVEEVSPIFVSDVIPQCRSNRSYSWSPNGDMLAFEAGERIYISTPAASSAPILVGDGVGPAWSADGKRVAFSAFEFAESEPPAYCVIREADISRPESTRIVIKGGEAPAYSPDGKLIAFTRGSKILIANADGSGEQVMTDVAPSVDIQEYGFEGPRQLVWSPDSKSIAFDYSKDWEGEYKTFTYVLELDGSRRPRALGEGWRPTWSPDSQRIAFERYEGKDAHGLYMVDVKTDQAPMRITDGMDPHWSPDGSHLVFTR